MKSPITDYTDSEIVRQLQQDNEKVFEFLFNQYHVGLFRFALRFVRMQTVAEEIVHDVLLYTWERRHQLTIDTSLKSYLYTAVKHRALDYLKSQYARQVYEREVPEHIKSEEYADEELQGQELKTIIGQAIERLPEKCRLIFRLSRNANLSYKEIAEQLDISPKTVEAQMGIALQRIRKYVETHWDLLWWLPFVHFLFW